MKRTFLVLIGLCACTVPGHAASAVPAHIAMDSAQVDRLCVRPAYVRVGLLACELKDQSPPVAFPISPFEAR